MTTYRSSAAVVPVEDEDDFPPSLPARILAAWSDMHDSTRRLLSENPPEGRLLFFVILSDMAFFLSWTLKTLLAPTAAAAAALPIDIALWLLAAMLLRTLSLYALAAAARIVCTAFGGTGDWHATRVAVFWGALVAAPFGLLAAVLGVGLSAAERTVPALASPVFSLPPYYIGLVPFLWFLAAGIATAHGFQRTGWTFLGLSVATVALSLAGVYLSR